MSRGRLLFAALFVVVASAAGGWFAAAQVKSPAESAASARPPEASPITAPVERRAISTNVVTRGTARYSDPVEVALAASQYGGASRLVTDPPVVGAELAEGSVAMEVAGHPVFLLQGARPMYRDITPGSTGPDVLQLEEALERLGFAPGPVDGTYDAATQAAVERWYEAAGYGAHGPTEAQRRDLRSGRDAVTSATSRVREAERALDDRKKPPTAVDLLSARAEVETAGNNLASAQTNVAKENDAARRAVAEKTEALETAQRNAARATEKAKQEVETKTSALETAKNSASRDQTSAERAVSQAASSRDSAAVALGTARLRLQQAQGGVHPDSGNPPTAAELAQLQQAVASANTAHVNANADVAAAQQAIATAQQSGAAAIRRAELDLEAAKQALADAPADGERAIRAAQAELDLAKAAVPLTAERVAAAVTQAQNTLDLARARFDRLQDPPDTASLEAALGDARADLARTTTELARLEAEIGIVVPASNVVFLASLPVRVGAVAVERGQDATGKVMTVTGSALTVDAGVLLVDAKLLQVGMKVEIDARDSAGISVPGTITSVADRPGTNGLDAQHVSIEITPDESPAALRDASARIVIPVKSTGGEVLAVPIAALSTGADGVTRVQKLDSGGAIVPVPVQTGLSASGMVEVSVLEGELRERDRVVVGQQ